MTKMEAEQKAIIPSTASRTRPIAYDAIAYKERNRIERFWCRLKDWRRSATRYDKLARNYLRSAYLCRKHNPAGPIESGP